MRGELGALAAMVRANARYWPTVLPRVQGGLRRWEQAAGRIPDPELRTLALTKIAGERFNTEVAATLATLAPRSRRARTIDAIVPLQVMYDYLDGLSEEGAADPLGASRRLFAAFTAALALDGKAPEDFYAGLPGRDDGGYLEALVAACRDAFAGLPRARSVAPAAHAAARRCGESQTRTHAIGALGTEQLSEWADAEARGSGLTWWEYTAGGTASILCIHALIAAAADPRTTTDEAWGLDRAYLYISAISTLLDSVIDYRRDLADGGHSFIAYYGDEVRMAAGIGAVIGRAAVEAQRIRNGGHHQMTAAGVAAYYLSAPAAAEPPGPAAAERAKVELGALFSAGLGVFRAWRLAKATAARR
jgi:tetraprenyl-beta-curcumene synthase